MASLVAAAAGGVCGQPLIHGNESAVTLIVTMFSLLAGLLVGILTLVSDPALLPTSTWRAADKVKGALFVRMRAHRLLFLVYLSTLAAIFAASVLQARAPVVVKWLETAYLSLSILGFIYSFTLPWSLARLQRERLEGLVDDLRRKDGIPPAEGRMR